MAARADQPSLPIGHTWEPPRIAELPTDAELDTTTVARRTYRITRLVKATGDEPGTAPWENLEGTLFFRGTGGGGLKGSERLIVEDYTPITTRTSSHTLEQVSSAAIMQAMTHSPLPPWSL